MTYVYWMKRLIFEQSFDGGRPHAEVRFIVDKLPSPLHRISSLSVIDSNKLDSVFPIFRCSKLSSSREGYETSRAWMKAQIANGCP